MTIERENDERLRHAYELLRELLEPSSDPPLPEHSPWYAPPLPPLDAGGRLSATDLLSWWFRPPSKVDNPWDRYFAAASGRREIAASSPSAPSQLTAPVASSHDLVSRTAIRALLPALDDGLAADDADGAVATLYEFLHAFGRRDVDGAMTHVADDYHAFEDEVDVDRGALRSRLENLLSSLHGCTLSTSLSMVPEAVAHPYGVIVYAEIQVNAVHSTTREKRSLLERRLVLLQRHGGEGWKIAAFGRVRS